MSNVYFNNYTQASGANYNQAKTSVPTAIAPTTASHWGAYLNPLPCTVKYIQYNIYHTDSSADGTVSFGFVKVNLDEDPLNPTHDLTATSFGAFSGTAKKNENTYGTLAGVPSTLNQWDVLIPYIKSDRIATTHFYATIHFEN